MTVLRWATPATWVLMAMALAAALALGLFFLGYIPSSAPPAVQLPPVPVPGPVQQPGDLFIQMMCIGYFLGWYCQLMFTGRFFSMKALLNTLAALAALGLALWAVVGNADMYYGVSYLLTHLRGGPQSAIVYIMLASLLIGWGWLVVIMCRVGFALGRFSRQSRDCYLQWRSR